MAETRCVPAAETQCICGKDTLRVWRIEYSTLYAMTSLPPTQRDIAVVVLTPALPQGKKWDRKVGGVYPNIYIYIYIHIMSPILR